MTNTQIPRLPQAELPYALCPAHAQAAYEMLLSVYLETEYHPTKGVGPELESAFINIQHEVYAEPVGTLPHWMYPERPADLPYNDRAGNYIPHKITPDDCPECATISADTDPGTGANQ